MTLRNAIEKRSIKGLVEVVDKAVSIYKAECPKDVSINTAYGAIPSALLIDEESKWQTITAEYVDILNAAERISDTLDKDVEIAKLIATSPILRNVGCKSSKDGGLL